MFLVSPSANKRLYNVQDDKEQCKKILNVKDSAGAEAVADVIGEQ